MKPKEMAERYRKGQSIRSIAADAKIDKSTVRLWLRNLKVQIRPSGPRKGVKMPAHKRKLTPEQMGALYQRGLCTREIGELAGIGKSTARRTIKSQTNVQMRPRGSESKWHGRWKEFERRVCDAWIAGDSIQTIAKDLRAGHSTVTATLDKIGMPHHPGHRQEAKLKAAERKADKLTAEEKQWRDETIERMYMEGASCAVIGEELGMNSRKVSGIVQELGHEVKRGTRRRAGRDDHEAGDPADSR